MPIIILLQAARGFGYTAIAGIVRCFTGRQIYVGLVTAALTVNTSDLLACGMYPLTGFKMITHNTFDNPEKVAIFILTRQRERFLLTNVDTKSCHKAGGCRQANKRRCYSELFQRERGHA